MRIIGFFLIIGILLSYVPVFPMDECPDGNHMGNVTKMDCGSIFHCPLISAVTVSDPVPLPFSGRVFSIPLSFKVDGLPRLIYHPPEHSLKHTLFEVG